MIGLPPSVLIYLCAQTVDMRMGFDGLSAIVRHNLGLNPLSGHLFLFLGKRRDRVKILFWDRDGYALFYKRLERGRFHFPPLQEVEKDASVRSLGSREMALLLEGVDLTQTRKRKRFRLPKGV